MQTIMRRTIFSDISLLFVMIAVFTAHAEAFSHGNFKKIDPFNKNSEIRKGGGEKLIRLIRIVKFDAKLRR